MQNVKLKKHVDRAWKNYHKALQEFRFNEALGAVWELISFCDKYIEKEKPWQESPRQKQVIGNLLLVVGEVADMLKPFLPETAEKILKQLKGGEPKTLFPRLAR